MLLTDWQADGQTGGDLREEQTSTGKIARLLTWKIIRCVACFEIFKNWRSTYQLLLASWSCKSLDPAIAARRQCMWIRAEAKRASERACVRVDPPRKETKGRERANGDKTVGKERPNVPFVCVRGRWAVPRSKCQVRDVRDVGRWFCGRWLFSGTSIMGPQFCLRSGGTLLVTSGGRFFECCKEPPMPVL
jgi:hypothetical protein